MEERLQKIMAQAGLGSRRACEAMIYERRVTVNGQVAELGQKADAAVDKIKVDGRLLAATEQMRYIALHKPRGAVSSLDPQGERDTVRDLIPFPERLYPVGRLDAESEGLILLTNDGGLTNHLTHPRYETEKEYTVLVRGTPDPDQLATWRRGVVLEGKRTAPAQVWRENASGNNTWLRVIMHEGRKHQIRDVGATIGLPVIRLIRVRMGTLELDELKPGEWRELNLREVQDLRGGKPRAAQSKPRAAESKPRPAQSKPRAPQSKSRPSQSKPRPQTMKKK